MGMGLGHKSALHRAVPGLPNIGIEAPPWAPSPMLALRVPVQLLCFCLGTNIYSEPLGARHCAGCCEHGSVRHARSLTSWSLLSEGGVGALPSLPWKFVEASFADGPSPRTLWYCRIVPFFIPLLSLKQHLRRWRTAGTFWTSTAETRL